VDVCELTYSHGGVILTATTSFYDAFETVNRALESSPLLPDAINTKVTESLTVDPERCLTCKFAITGKRLPETAFLNCSIR
jgi:hypothetical protein